MIEYILEDLVHAEPDWSISVLRYFNPVGADSSGLIGEDPNGIPNNLMPFIAQVAVGKRASLSIFGNDYDTHDGTGVRDYIHVVDLACGHLKALQYLSKHQGIEAINLGTGTGYSVLDMVKAFSKVNNVAVPYNIAPRRAGDIASCYAQPDKAFNLLSWQAEKTLDDMVRDSWRWQRQNPNGYSNS
jgi:UDP-glucose 4-epimerase